MRVIFLGVGEAFDAALPNNCHLILSETTLLLNCGFSAVQQVWQYNGEADFLDAVFISHLHGDHCFGLPSPLARNSRAAIKERLKGTGILVPEPGDAFA